MEQKIEKDRRLKLLWSSNAVWSNSGYGVETGLLTQRFKQDGWDIRTIAWAGLEGGEGIDMAGIPTYPRINSTWGDDAMLFHGRYYDIPVYFTFHDVWVLNPQILQQMHNEGKRVIMYVPVDQDPVPPNVLSNLRFAYKIISLSKFGQKALMKNGFSSKLIVEGTDMNIFKPLDKAECRKIFNLPQDAFIVGMIGANKENPPRKGWQEALTAFKMFHDKHPESLFFYLSNQDHPSGFPIRQFAHHLGLDSCIGSVDPYLAVHHFGSKQVNQLLNSFDFLTHASLSEGFGLVIVEAQAAGCPVIVNRAQSQPELVIENKTGLICESDRKFFTGAGGYYFMPSVDSLYACYEKLFRTDRKKMGLEGRAYVSENFNIDKIYDNHWKTYLANLQEEILGKPKIDVAMKKS